MVLTILSIDSSKNGLIPIVSNDRLGLKREDGKIEKGRSGRISSNKGKNRLYIRNHLTIIPLL